ncbi:MAG TPA: DUF3592 domain-containing protein [Gammaproteobacteria bacterium]|nr:DUF3592 domain-containing protein [Gammaproteobacteria bacterium]
MAASLLLAATCLAVGYQMSARRVELLRQGRQAVGVVVAIDVGVRGLKTVVAEFTSADGRRLEGLDIHKTQWFAANEVGDRVTLYYDPLYEGEARPDILIERGLWIWSDPALLIGGGILLLALGVYLARQQRRNASH